MLPSSGSPQKFEVPRSRTWAPSGSGDRAGLSLLTFQTPGPIDSLSLGLFNSNGRNLPERPAVQSRPAGERRGAVTVSVLTLGNTEINREGLRHHISM